MIWGLQRDMEKNWSKKHRVFCRVPPKDFFGRLEKIWHFLPHEKNFPLRKMSVKKKHPLGPKRPKKKKSSQSTVI